MTTPENTIAYLEQQKSRLVTELALGTAPQARVGAQIELLDELIKDLTPKPPVQGYFVLYHVEWQPEHDGDDAPMDRDHDFYCTDPRRTASEMIAIGSAHHIDHELRNIL